jgi:hypothetical protein
VDVRCDTPRIVGVSAADRLDVKRPLGAEVGAQPVLQCGFGVVIGRRICATPASRRPCGAPRRARRPAASSVAARTPGRAGTPGRDTRGADRVLFASDYPLLAHEHCLREARALRFKGADRFTKFVATNDATLFLPPEAPCAHTSRDSLPGR